MGDATCSVDGCQGQVSSRGWCMKHYTRWRHWGSPAGGPRNRGLSPIEKFWARVEKTETCWLWTGRLNKPGDLGYGSLVVGGKVVYVHRFSYELHRQPLQDGQVIDHLCRVRRCVNPDHLEAVTQSENVLRGDRPKLARASTHTKTHCPKGHPYDEANTYIEPKSQHRLCRICKNAQRRARAARLRVARTKD